jgi:1-phosphatidylinositol-3-phosphate 5-kinase
MVTDLLSLFSFAKFLELMLYSPTVYTLSHPLCEHTPPSSPSTSLPASRFNVIRHFSHKSYQVSFALSLVDDIFDLRMPRLQFMRDGWVEKTPPAMTSNTMIDDTDKKELRQEIKHWWQAIAEHLDKVVSFFLIPTRRA